LSTYIFTAGNLQLFVGKLQVSARPPTFLTHDAADYRAACGR